MHRTDLELCKTEGFNGKNAQLVPVNENGTPVASAAKYGFDNGLIKFVYSIL
jgi:hypothetical protein